MKKAVLIFSGYNQRAVVAFLRTLEKNRVSYGIIASSSSDTIFLTKYKEKVVAIRDRVSLDKIDLLKKIEASKQKLEFSKCLIAPSTEALNRFLLDNREEFEKHGCEIPLVSKTIYELISDKKAFSELCKKSNIFVPEEYDDASKAKIPFVAKPKNYFNEQGYTYSPILIFNDKQKNQFITDYQESDFFYQDYIDGQSYYLLYYFYKNGNIAKFSQKNLAQQPGGKSILQAESSDFHKTTESKKYEDLFSSLKFFGLVMVEVKQNNNKNYMIEANPRFWGPAQLFIDAGINLFDDFLIDNGIAKDRPVSQYKFAKYLWAGGYDKQNDREDLNLEEDVYNRGDTKEIFKTETGITT